MQKFLESVGFEQSWTISSFVTLSLGVYDEDKGVIDMRTRRGSTENMFLVTQEKAIFIM